MFTRGTLIEFHFATRQRNEVYSEFRGSELFRAVVIDVDVETRTVLLGDIEPARAMAYSSSRRRSSRWVPWARMLNVRVVGTVPIPEPEPTVLDMIAALEEEKPVLDEAQLLADLGHTGPDCPVCRLVAPSTLRES
jgi:hypothetical protein